MEEVATMRKVMFATFLTFAFLRPEAAGAAELKQETSEAFDHYIRVTEDRMAEELHDGRAFFAEPQRDKINVQLRQGEIIVERLETLEKESASGCRTD
jgi:hypothetical protein